MAKLTKLRLATRGSALALTQTSIVEGLLRDLGLDIEPIVKVIRTTGDKLQRASMANAQAMLPKGLFTKELESALMDGKADVAVHSLKDLPTEMPSGLRLGAVLMRADVRDVLVVRKNEVARPKNLRSLPRDSVLATSSTRRRAQVLMHRADLNVIEIRGNVGTRLKKLSESDEFSATILAAAGMDRLGITITSDGTVVGEGVPGGLVACRLSLKQIMPCVGQGAVALQIREGDEPVARICQRLNHESTFVSVSAERAFLRALGGGCQSPVAAYASVHHGRIELRAISFIGGFVKHGYALGSIGESEGIGTSLAEQLLLK